jgi:indolepyruvate ferredoxin oxidoreductase
MGMLFPMEPSRVRDFAQGLEEIFVIEEKRPFLEMFAKTCSTAGRMRRESSARLDEEERELLPGYGEFESDVIGRALTRRPVAEGPHRVGRGMARAPGRDPSARQARHRHPHRVVLLGCPHNSSTAAVEGSLVSAGIGCHTMAMWMDRNVVMGTHMGAEGAQWIGMAPFTDTKHIFQNMGDGTYAHSGSLAVRYCAATNTNITFKVLRNMHTSMTGGQAITGAEPVANMVSGVFGQRRQEGDRHHRQPDNTRRHLPGGTEVWHRDRSTRRSALAATRAPRCCCTTRNARPSCAARAAAARPRSRPSHRHQRARLRRLRRLRREVELHERRAGATEFGRKTRIHQTSCNKDFSCVKGFCPSFLTITPNPEPAARRRPKKKKKGRIPALERRCPTRAKVDASFGFGIHVMGIGGTGSVTVVATLANAARLEGKHVIGSTRRVWRRRAAR